MLVCSATLIRNILAAYLGRSIEIATSLEY